MDPLSPAGPSSSSSGQIVKGTRKGTRSCVECRHRKIRIVSTESYDEEVGKLYHQVPSLRPILNNPREWLTAVASYATPWMSLYMSIFPYTSPIDTKEELISQHDEMQSPTAHPVTMAMFLCTFAITAQQVPPDQENTSPPLNWKDAPTYARQVAQAVEATIISHTGLAMTVEGIEMAILLLRLQLGLGAIRSLWLSLRRTVALAELIGLPRFWYSRRDDLIPATYTPGSSTSSSRDRITQKIAIWTAICLTDRLSSMMFNLPAATSSHRFPRKDIMTPEGEVLVASHLFELSSLALEVQALDEACMMNESAEETYQNVLTIDCRLRTLKSQTPTSWWNDWPHKASSASLVQFWHFYLTARIHLHAAMSPDEQDQFSYSRTACEQACETLSRLYPGLRYGLPSGFFLCRIIDMQIYTAVAFLLLTSMRGSNATDPRKIAMAQTILETMDAVSNRTSHVEFISGASSTIRSLIALARDGSSSSQSLTLRIPLLGKVRIGRKKTSGSGATANQPQDHEAAMPQMQQAQAAEQSYSNQGAPSATRTAEVNQQHYDMSNSNTLPWLMELDMNSQSLQYPFLADDITHFDQWLSTDSGMALNSI
ncbi:Hypothetical predicted protein [Lecanosticta acicola]|uniref:Transcription factor domain-containing protein n=1 Tax=Lecanosticta acicola TaxID=111012 RepID=A0AAI9E3K5_9PEZI|nr:Hypothetical predicted protein [Lecanosticta acicola]